MTSRPPPKAPIPLSTDEMAIIKKKVAPPKGPPPAGFANFKAPKKYDEDNEEENYHDHRRNNRNSNDSDEDNPRGNKRGIPHRYHDDDDDNQSDEKLSNRNQHQHQHHHHPPPHPQHHHHQQQQQQQQQHYRQESDEIDDDNRQQQNHRHHHHHQYRDEDDDDHHSPSSNSKRNSRPTGRDENDDYIPVSNRDRKQSPSASRDHESLQIPLPSASSSSTRLRIYNYKKVLRSSFKELKVFVTTPCEMNTIVRCYIERNRNGSNYLTPVYSLCADLEDGTGRELITCRKFLKSKTSYYIFSLKSEDLYRKREQRGRYYLGKLRAISNDSYVLFDNGVCDTMRGNGTSSDTVDEVSLDDDDEENGHHKGEMTPAGGGHDHEESSLYRSQLAVMQYNSKHRPVPEGERGMEICIPRLMTGNDLPQGTKHADIVTSFEKIRISGRQNDLFGNKFLVLHEKRSRYDPLSSCLVDFQGRATVASVKNFQLILSSPMNDTSRNSWSLDGREDDIILQMGKITGECFNMDFKYPLNMLQAFAIAISRFDANLTW